MSVKQAETLIQLQSRQSQLEADVDDNLTALKKAQFRYEESKRDLVSVKSEIKALQSTNISVSEHAIVRYMERAMGFDIEEIRRKIVTDELIKLHGKLGNKGKYPIGDGLRAVVDNNVVITVM